MPSINFFNTANSELNFQVNLGELLEVPAASPNGQPGRRAVAYRAGQPEPGIVGYGENLITLHRLNSAGQFYLSVPNEALINPNLYFNPKGGGFDWLLMNAGRVLASGWCNLD